MKLLIVEDDVTSAELVIRVFQGLGYEVTHTIYGLHGIRLARQQKFDAVLLDFGLPDIDGAQICLVLRMFMKSTPIIALTAQNDAVTRQKAKKFGFSGFIAKPWSIVELISMVQGLIEQQSECL